jgi:hypothetical protein
MERDQASKFVNDLLRLMVSRQGSDLFLTADFPPAIKVDGKVTKVSPQPLTGAHTMALARAIMNDKQASDFERTKECNFAISPQGIGRFRVNAFVQQGQVGLVLRTIPQTLPTIDTLNLPQVLFDDLAPGRPLPRNDLRVVVGWHQYSITLGNQRPRDRLAILAGAIVKHDLGAQRSRALALGAWGVRGHDDDGRHAEQLRRGRHALGMITGGKRHHAAPARGLRNLRNLVVGAAKLERAGALQGLGLEKHPRAEQRIEHRRIDERRANGDAGQCFRGGVDVGGGGRRNCVGGCHRGKLGRGATGGKRGSETGLRPYQSARLRRYDAVS